MIGRDSDCSASAADEAPAKLEVCIDRLGDALAAVDAGASRLEVCSALELGGLTPSIGLIKQIATETDVEMAALIRPRAGGFYYDRHDFTTTLRDAAEALNAGAHAVVVGFLNQDGTVDVDATGQMVQHVGNTRCVFHRAFDFTPDQFAAFDQLIELKVRRVLTSGGMPSAEAGAGRLRELAQRAEGRIEVMPGGGVRPENMESILQTTGCRQVHVGASVVDCDPSLDGSLEIPLRAANFRRQGEYRMLNADAVKRIAKLLQ